MDLYHKRILDHYRSPRNVEPVKNPDVTVNETNASCGDNLHLEVKFNQGAVAQVGYNCHGCALVQAASSMLSEAVKGKTGAEIKALDMEDVFDLIGGPVSPAREKCVGLGLKALQKAVETYEKDHHKKDTDC